MTVNVSRAAKAISLLLCGLALAACGSLAAMGDPTHRYVLELEIELASDAKKPQQSGETEQTEPKISSIPDPTMQDTMDVLRRRLEADGIEVHSVERQGTKQIILETIGALESDNLDALLARGSRLAMRPVDQEADPVDLSNGIAPIDSDIVPMADGSGNLALRRIGGVDGKYVASAMATPDPNTGRYVINLTLDEKGARRFAGMSQANIGNMVAIVIDGEIISAPIIREPILGGQVMISGDFSQESATELSIGLGSGMLLAPLVIIEEREMK